MIILSNKTFCTVEQTSFPHLLDSCFVKVLLSTWVLQFSTIFTNLVFSINMPSFSFREAVALSTSTLPSTKVHFVIQKNLE